MWPVVREYSLSYNSLSFSIIITISLSHTHCVHICKSARFLITHIEPVGVAAVIPFVAALLLFYSLAFLLKTGCIDPGIVPRSHPDELAYQIAQADEGEEVNVVKGKLIISKNLKQSGNQ